MMTGSNYMDQASQFIYESQVPVDGRFFKNKFTPAEDAALMQLVDTFRETDWKVIAAHMPTRDARQCRERYKNYLNPDLRQGGWTSDEDMLLTEQFMKHGAKWNTIARAFINRSDLALRNRWQVLERRQTNAGKTALLQSENQALGVMAAPMEQPTPDVFQIEQPGRPVSPFTFTNLFDFGPESMDDPFNSWSFFY
jgi:hypothetical protein